MKRRCVLSVLPMLGMLLLATSFAGAAENFLKLLPEGAWGFVVVNHPADADAKLQTISREMTLPEPNLLDTFKQEAEIKDGLDENATAALLVLPPENGSPAPSPIFLIPVTDYDKFIAQLNPEDAKAKVTKVTFLNGISYVRHIGGYAALTNSQLRKSLESLKVANEAPAALKAWGEWTASRDAAGVILQPGIKNVSAMAQKQIAMAKMMFGQAGEQGKQAVAVFTIYEKMFQTAEKEAAGIGLGVQLDKQNALRVTTRTEMTPEGNAAKFLAAVSPSKENLLQGLPGDPMIAAGGLVLSDDMTKELMKFSLNLMKSMPEVYGLSEEKIDKMSDLMSSKLKGIHSMSMAMGLGKSDEPLYANTLGIMKVDDSQKFVAGYEQYFQQYNELVKDAKSSMVKPMEVEKCEIAGVPGLQVKMEMPKPQEDAMPGPMPSQYDKMMESMLGPGGKMVFYIAPADEHTVAIGYVTKEPLERMIASLKQKTPGLAADAGVLKTAALLPADSPIVGYFNPQGGVEFVKRMMSITLPPGMADRVNIPDFPATPPVGFAVKIAPNELQTTMAVPAEVLKGLGQYIQHIRGMTAEGVSMNK